MRKISLFLASAAFVLFGEGTANAVLNSKVHASACNQSGGLWSYSVTSGLVASVGVSTLYCPFVDDYDGYLVTSGGVTTRNIQGLDVYGEKTAAGVVSASSCVTFRGPSYGYLCGTASTASATGQYVITPSVSVWQSSPYDYAFVKIDAPAGGAVSGILVSQ